MIIEYICYGHEFITVILYKFQRRSMNLFVFPGQGSQKIGMAADLYNDFKIVQDLFEEAQDLSSLPLKNIIFNGQPEDLKPTRVSQIALLLASISVLRTLEEVHGTQIKDMASYVAGHSLGEYSALVAAGSLKFGEAVKLLTVRSQAMEEAYPSGGAMLAVIGIAEPATLLQIAKEASEATAAVCEVANDNAPGQVILSGESKAIEVAAKIAKETYKAKMVKILEVSGPFHSSLMKPAQMPLEEALSNLITEDAQVPVITNVEAMPTTEAESIKKLLVAQLVKPVRWRESMLKAAELGVDNLIEVGPNTVLCGLMKRINSRVVPQSIQNLEDIKNFKQK